MKHLLLTTIAAVVLATTAFSDPIHDAAGNGDLAGVQAELDKGVDVNKKNSNGRTPLHIVAYSRLPENRKEIAELLIDNGADLNAKNDLGNTPLDEAGENSNYDICELLKNNGCEYSNIVTATQGGDLEAVKEFLAAGADVNEDGRSAGRTLLNRATFRGHLEMAQFLIQNGADIDARETWSWVSGDYGMTPLHNALFLIWEDRTDIVKMLVLNGANINTKASAYFMVHR